MTLQELAPALRQALLALGLLFVVVDLRVAAQLLTWWRKRALVVVAWPSPKPPFYAINLAIGVMLGILLFVNAAVVRRPAASVFGVGMMFLYYGYLLPLSTRIRHGLYQDGIWTDSGFMPYTDIGGLTWKSTSAAASADEDDTLVIASSHKAVARRLRVPGQHLGEVRHYLRDKIGEHAIEFEAGPGLHLGTRDTRESV